MLDPAIEARLAKMMNWLSFILFFNIFYGTEYSYNLMNNSQVGKAVEKDYDYFTKVVIVGDSAVGKTNLLLRFVNG